MRSAWTRVRRGIGIVCAVPHANLAGLASIGLVTVLIALPAFALWGAMRTYETGAAARHATELSDSFGDARYAVGAEESLERKYRLQPSAEVRDSHRAAAVALAQALGTVLIGIEPYATPVSPSTLAFRGCVFRGSPLRRACA